MENIETLLAAVAQTQGFDDDEPLDVDARPLGFHNSSSSPEIREEMGEPELTGAPFEVCGDDWPSVEVYPLPLAAVPAIGAGEKKKRGRPPRGQLAVKPPLSKRIKHEDEDEDVCFICFDGGSLVLCDRKGCPKAYHPTCIKRDEAFFQTKAKWNCGWHICSVCRKSSHYLCYTCTYSLCKRCTKDADYVCVRGNNGFCSTCMKIIMLIENKDQTNSDSVHVDFDDKLSWEYLFKVYWVLLKDKLSLTLNELTQARKPWKGVTAVGHKPQSRNAYYSAIDMKASISYRGNGHLELNKPYEDISLPQTDRSKDGVSGTDNHVESQSNAKEVEVPGYNKHPEKPNMDGFIAKPSIDQRAEEPGIEKATDKPTIEEATDKLTIERAVDKPNIEKATDTPSKPCNEKTSDKPSIEKAADEPHIRKTTDKPGIEKDGYNPGIVENTIMPYICKNGDELKEKDPKSGPCNSTEWATKDLLEFIAHMKNGDTSPLSQFDVQTLILDYIKRNNLRDPHQKSQIICDLRLTNLFGRARVGHIEMLKLLEYHFLIKEDSKKNSFIPAGFVGSPDTNVEGNNCNLTMPIKSRKRKSRKKSEERAPQNNLSAYAAIDFHNINLIYLRRNLMENLIDDKEKFNDNVIGSIVRIKLSSNDQKPDVHRLVQVVGTGKTTQPYKVGDRTTDIILEVLNLDKKEALSIASISNQEFTEDECRRLRQSIRCGFMKQFTVGEIQNKAKALQLIRVNDWLEAEILRLNHLRDRASEKGHKKELREYVHKLQLLKSPEEYKRRISEVPEIHTNPKMSPNYESEEDAKCSDNVKKDEYQTPSYPGFSRSERNTISPNKKGKQEASTQAQNQMVQNISASGSHSLGKKGRAMHRSNFETATASTRNSPSTNHIETEKLWHYRDPNGKIQGPFSMMQLRKWSTTGLFPPDMRIWTNHEQYDSLLLTHAMNRQFHGASEQPQNASLGTQRQESTMVIGESEGFGVTNADSKRTEAVSSNHTIDLSQRDSKQNNATSSCHAIDLSGRVSKQTNAYCSNHAVDLAERDSKEANADSCPNAVDLAERDSKQTSAVDLTGEDRKQTNAGSSNHAIDLSEIESKQTKEALSNHAIDLSVRDSEQTNAATSNHADRNRKQINAASSNHAIDLSDGNTGSVKTDETNSPAWPQCWDLLKDSYPVADNVQMHNVLHSSSLEQTNAGTSIRDEESGELNHDSQNEAKSPSEPTQDQLTSEHEVQSQSGNQGHVLFSAEETLRSLSIDLMSSNDMDSESLPVPALGAADAIEPDADLHVADLNTPIIMPNTSKTEIAEKQKRISADVIHMQTFLELLSPTPRSNDEDQGVRETDEKQSGLIEFPLPNSGPSWTNLIAGAQLPDEDWCRYSPTPAKPQVQEWDPGLVSASSLTQPPPKVTSENVVPSATNNNNDNQLTLASPSYPTSWLAMLNEPIEFDALGEESVSDLLAEVDAMESQGGGGFPSPTSAMKFAKELQDCKDDCFSSIEDFRSAPHPVKSDAFSSTEEVQLAASQSSGPTPIDFLDTLRRSCAHSSASSEGETNVPAFSSSEYYHPAPSNTSQDMVGSNVSPNTMDPGWGTVQGNINLVTVQGNVNLVLGGHSSAQGMANLGWGTNPGTPWGANPNINRGPINGGSLGLPWDGQQRKYEGERFTSPREWSYQGGQAAFGRGGGRPPWGRQAYGGGGGGGGYSRPIPKGQRVCKFYESGRCKKGAFCDYLHP